MKSDAAQPLQVMGAPPQTPPPLGLYVHLPWCIKKCPYCDFNSHRAPAALPEDEYVDALAADLKTELPAVWGRRVRSIYFGGGTPSLFSPRAVERMLSHFRAMLAVEADAEITMEANPGAADEARFAGFAAAGVNRLSLGAQSFAKAQLRALGRAHDEQDARRAMKAAVKIFDEVNVDLMHALPGQSAAMAAADVKEAAQSGAAHLSLYHLTLEENTPFFKRPPPRLPAHDAAADIAEAARAAAEEAGFNRYEISAYVKDDGNEHRSAHNLNYWRFGDYVGIGAGAHGKTTARGRIARSARIKHPAAYMRQLQENQDAAERWTVGRADVVFEFMLNAMRLPEGFSPSVFFARTAAPLPEAQLQKAESLGLVYRTAQIIRPTEKGLRFGNDLLSLFLPKGEGDARQRRDE